MEKVVLLAVMEQIYRVPDLEQAMDFLDDSRMMTANVKKYEERISKKIEVFEYSNVGSSVCLRI